MLRDEGLLVHDGDGWMLRALPAGWLPPTIHALLSARIDRLEREDRHVLDPAAVIGHIFPLAAIAELADGLAPDEVANPRRRARAARRSCRPSPSGRHRLPRLPSHLHPRLGVREPAQAPARVAARAVRRVGRPGQRRPRARVRGDPWLPPRTGAPVSLRARACRRSRAHARRPMRPAASSAGRRAFVRGDMPAAANLLRRALERAACRRAPSGSSSRPIGGGADADRRVPGGGGAARRSAGRGRASRRDAELAGGARVVLQLIRLFSGGADDWSDEARANGRGRRRRPRASSATRRQSRAPTVCSPGSTARPAGTARRPSHSARRSSTLVRQVTSGRSDGPRRRTRSPRRKARRRLKRRSSAARRWQRVSPVTARPRR